MLSIVIPVFNGEKNIAPLIKQIKPAVSVFDEDWELIFVDDGSTDDSLRMIQEAAVDESRIGWLSFRQNAGQQLAVLCGLRHSKGDCVITMDDDLDHPVEMISRLYDELKKGWDAVYAVPNGGSRGGGLMRDLFFRSFLKKPAGLRIGSFRIFSRRAVDVICEAVQPFVYISAELFRSKLNISSIQYEKLKTMVTEPAGSKTRVSRYSFASRLRLYLKLLRWYGPVSSRRAGTQYEIERFGGCL